MKMAQAKLENILFLDIETAPAVYKYADLKPAVKELWDKKWAYNPENKPAELYNKAGVYAEFSKVICIGLGYYYKGKFRVKAIVNKDEKKLLTEFAELVKTHFNKAEHFLCAHNGKEFDYPFLSRRMIINNVPFPRNFQLQGLKPWDVKHLDTMEMWRFGDIKNFTSLNLLANVLDIPSPKDDMDGSQVAKVFYEENNIDKIKNYCLKDVVTLARIYSRYTGQKSPDDKDIIFA
jgi:uncharacterized protein YprB with RNaseH-like and TPR domain